MMLSDQNFEILVNDVLTFIERSRLRTLSSVL